MLELTPQQIRVVELLFGAGFRLIALPPYENVLCMRRGDCAALLAPVPNGGLRLLTAPTYLLEGNLSVKIKKGNREVFVWKEKEMEATAERLEELDRFRAELRAILETSVQS